MKALMCTNCGASKWSEEGSYLICLFCGTKHIKEPNELSGSNNATISQSDISLDNDIRMLLQKCKTDKKNASKYANLVLDIDPTNKEALKYAKKKWR